MKCEPCLGLLWDLKSRLFKQLTNFFYWSRATWFSGTYPCLWHRVWN